MAQYKQLYSIIQKDGKKHAVDIFQWGLQTLSGPELTEFTQDMLNFLEDEKILISNGEITIENIVEYITTSESAGNVIVGYLTTRSENMSTDPRILKWSTQMQQDPKVIKYNPETRIS